MPDPILQNQNLDGYTLVRKIGEGGFGEVWLAQSIVLQTYHALKIISVDDPKKLKKELDSLKLYRAKAARVPQLIPIEHFNINDIGLFYLMPLADSANGKTPANPDWLPLTLSEKIARQKTAANWFDSTEIIALITPILTALQSLSDAGLVHRDVKPDNILFLNGQATLADISLIGHDHSQLTRRGTPGYATPSWYVGGLPDMFGVAVTLYTLMTGNAPDKLGRAAFLWPPQGEKNLTPSEHAKFTQLHNIIRRAVEEKPTDRYLDFVSMAKALQESSQTQKARPKSSLKRKLLLTVVPLALIVATPIILKVIRENSQNTQQTKSIPPQAKPAEKQHEPEATPESTTPELSHLQQADYAAMAGLAQSYYEDGKYDSTLLVVDQLRDTYPQARSHHAYSYLRALALFGLNRYDEATEELLSEVNNIPDIAYAIERDTLYRDMGKPEAGKKDLTRLLDTHGPNTLLFSYRAQINAELGDYPAVEQDRESALKLNPDKPETQKRLVDLLWQKPAENSPGYATWLKKHPHTTRIISQVTIDEILAHFEQITDPILDTKQTYTNKADSSFPADHC